MLFQELLRKLFELEIPEITSGLIEIKAVAREAGSRAKVAVYSADPNIDTVGACIGQKGLRIKNIVNELNGEKIDIVVWKESVENSQLSLAIGKNGQNARLAAKLTGMRVDIKTADRVEEGE